MIITRILERAHVPDRYQRVEVCASQADRLASSEDVPLDQPNAVVDSVEGRIGLEVKRLREASGMSLRAFADRSGFSPSFISQLENGQVSPSIASLAKISAALGITLPELFARSSDDESAVVRATARPTYHSSWSRADIAALTPRFGAMEGLIVTLEPEA